MLFATALPQLWHSSGIAQLTNLTRLRPAGSRASSFDWRQARARTSIAHLTTTFVVVRALLLLQFFTAYSATRKVVARTHTRTHIHTHVNSVPEASRAGSAHTRARALARKMNREQKNQLGQRGWRAHASAAALEPAAATAAAVADVHVVARKLATSECVHLFRGRSLAPNQLINARTNQSSPWLRVASIVQPLRPHIVVCVECRAVDFGQQHAKVKVYQHTHAHTAHATCRLARMCASALALVHA